MVVLSYHGRQRHWNIGGSQVERRRRENRGAVGGKGVRSGEGLYTERIADENDSDLRYSEVLLKGKK